MLATHSFTMPINADTLPEVLILERSNIVFIHRVLIPILSKQDLVTHYQLSGLRALRRQVLTDNVLNSCNISQSQYQGKWSFTAEQSARLYQVLQITWLRTNQKK